MNDDYGGNAWGRGLVGIRMAMTAKIGYLFNLLESHIIDAFPLELMYCRHFEDRTYLEICSQTKNSSASGGCWLNYSEKRSCWKCAVELFMLWLLCSAPFPFCDLIITSGKSHISAIWSARLVVIGWPLPLRRMLIFWTADVVLLSAHGWL